MLAILQVLHSLLLVPTSSVRTQAPTDTILVQNFLLMMVFGVLEVVVVSAVMQGRIYQEIHQVRMGLRMLAVEITLQMTFTGVIGQLQQITLFTLLSSASDHNVLYDYMKLF